MPLEKTNLRLDLRWHHAPLPQGLRKPAYGVEDSAAQLAVASEGQLRGSP